MKKLICALLLLPSISFAVDGVLEINQLCATTSGCFAGDSAGFPVTISSAGSYRLTGNLNVTDLPDPEDITAIAVSAVNASIDLNGFTISGPVFCTGSTVTSCSPSDGLGHGIEITTTTINSVTTIKNGVIRGMGLNGVLANSNAAISNVHVINSGGTGIIAFNRGHLRDNYVLRNGADGIVGGVMITNNIVNGNAGTGISPVSNGKVAGNRVNRNGDDGVDCNSCSLLENIISDNLGVGVNYSGRSIAGSNLIESNALGEIDGVPLEVAPNLCGGVAC